MRLSHLLLRAGAACELTLLLVLATALCALNGRADLTWERGVALSAAVLVGKGVEEAEA